MRNHAMKFIVLSAVWLAAIIVVGVAVQRWRVVAVVNDEIEHMQSERLRFTVEVHALRDRVTLAERVVQEPGGDPFARPEREFPDAGLESREAEIQRLHLQVERASLAGRYAAVVRQLGLTPTQAEKLYQIIYQRLERDADIEAAARILELDENDPVLGRGRSEVTRRFYAELTNALGQAALLSVQEHERALGVWTFVSRFAGAVALEGQPLSAAQATQLTQTLADASPPYRTGGIADTDQIDWPQAWSRTEAILTPPQQVSLLNMAPVYRVAPEGPPMPSGTSDSPRG